MRRFALMMAVFGIFGCGAEIESVNDIKGNDELRARALAACGKDGVVLRVLDLDDDETLCCLNYTGIFPRLECMTSSGATVMNPKDKQTIKAEAAKFKVKK